MTSILPALPSAEKAAAMPVPRVVCPEFSHLSLFTETERYQNSPLKTKGMKSCAINLIRLLIWMSRTVASSSFFMLATVITVCGGLFSSPKTTTNYLHMHSFLYFVIFLCFSGAWFLQFFLPPVPAHSYPWKEF